MADYAAPYACPECETRYWLMPPNGTCRGYWHTNADGAREFVAHTVPISVVDVPRTITNAPATHVKFLEPERKPRRERPREA